jgi:glycosyltransferase involved in cell wall biosynthesis
VWNGGEKKMDKEEIMSNCRYLIVTPVKDEGENLPNLIQSVVGQTVKPMMWIIVDDGSTDDSPKIIEDATNRYEWVKSVRLKESPRDLAIHFASVIKTGLDFAITYCREHSIQYDYICFLDADMIIRDKDFFKKIIAEFEKDPKLGIASGDIDEIGEVTDGKRRKDTVSGGEMVCRRECFEDVGRFPLSYAPDSVLFVKAKLRGWEIKRFNAVKIIQTRRTSSAEGLWGGFIIKGKSDHYLSYNPFIVVAKGLKYCLTRQNYKGVAYLYGYFDSLIQRKEQINDEEIRKYFYWYKPREIWQYYWNVFKNKLAKRSGGESK